MAQNVPVRAREYNGPITRGARWNSYRPRAGDIIICSPAKSGTTWTQAICAMLIFGSADLDVQPARISPSFDSHFEPLAPMLQRLEAQTHRRYLKTHTPLNGLPYYPEVSYLAVYRHPLDAFHSMASLALKTASGTARLRMPPDIRSFIQNCVRTPFVPGVGEQMSIGGIAHHLMDFWRHRAVPNIHLLHYANMKRDLAGSIKAIAAMLAIEIDDVRAEAIAEAASFGNMQAHAQKFAPESGGGWKSPADFFAGGTGGRWREFLTEGDIAEYRQTLSAAIPDPMIGDWLEHGGALPEF